MGAGKQKENCVIVYLEFSFGFSRKAKHFGTEEKTDKTVLSLKTASLDDENKSVHYFH
jgi:hypothetical protein